MSFRSYRNPSLAFVLASLVLAGSFLFSGCTQGQTWSVTQKDNDLQIAYGRGSHLRQYASLDLNSSYFRMVPLNCTWGTSVILFPSFWEKGASHPHQGSSVTSYEWYIDKNDLLLSIKGKISDLEVEV